MKYHILLTSVLLTGATVSCTQTKAPTESKVAAEPKVVSDGAGATS